MSSAKLILLSLLFFSATKSFSAILYVNQSGICSSTPCYTSINAAIAAAVNGDIIIIESGTYTENVIINKSIVLKGIGPGVSIIKPAVSNIGSVTSKGSQVATSSNVILIRSNDVTIQDLQVNGSNDALNGIEATVNGVSIDARNGIITDFNLSNAFTNIHISNVRVRNVFMRGIQVATNSGNENTANIHNCTVENVQGNSGSIGVYLNFGSGLLQNNSLDQAGMDVNYTHDVTISGNLISNYGECIRTENSKNIIIDGNTINSKVVNTNALYVLQALGPVNIKNNIIRNAGTGISVMGADAGVMVIVNNNSVDGKYGGYAGDPTSVGIFTTNEVPGYLVQANCQVNASVNNVVKNVNTGMIAEATDLFTDITTGLAVTTTGSFTNNTLVGNLSFQNISGNYIELVSTSNNTHVKNIDASLAAFDSYIHNMAGDFAIEDKIIHKLDNPALGNAADEGLVMFNPNYLFVTNNNGNNSIVRAMNALPVDGLHIVPKSGAFYPETIEVTHDLRFASDGDFSINDLKLSSGKDLILLSPLSIVHSLELSNGIITNGSNALTLKDNATVIGGSDQSHVNGAVRKIGDDAFVFPVGDGGYYRPCAISAPANVTDAFEAQYIHESARQTLMPSTIILPGAPPMQSVSDKEYWNISSVNGSSAVDIKLNWRNGVSDPVANLNNLVIARHINSFGWRNYGNQFNEVTDGLLWITINTIPQFGNFALGVTAAAGSLPLHTFTLTVANRSKTNVLSWHTTGENEIANFQVEKSITGNLFHNIGAVKPKNTDAANYEFADRETGNAKSYYRIKEVDQNGGSAYSNTVSVVNTFNSIAGYPNPCLDFFNLTGVSKCRIEVRNSSGQLVYQQFSTSSTLRVNCTSWNKGLYNFVIKDSNGLLLKTEKVVLQ